MSKLGFPNLGSRPDIENPAFQNSCFNPNTDIENPPKKSISNPKKAIIWFTLTGPELLLNYSYLKKCEKKVCINTCSQGKTFLDRISKDQAMYLGHDECTRWVS